MDCLSHLISYPLKSVNLVKYYKFDFDNILFKKIKPKHFITISFKMNYLNICVVIYSTFKLFSIICIARILNRKLKKN